MNGIASPGERDSARQVPNSGSLLEIDDLSAMKLRFQEDGCQNIKIENC
jgi:hypothetical protein